MPGAVSRRPSPPRLLLVTGMSGAGKSTVLDALEDMGWDIVDNLPADLLQQFVHGGDERRVRPVAVGMDVRSRGFDAGLLPGLISTPLLLPVSVAGNEVELDGYVIRPDRPGRFPLVIMTGGTPSVSSLRNLSVAGEVVVFL